MEARGTRSKKSFNIKNERHETDTIMRERKRTEQKRET